MIFLYNARIAILSQPKTGTTALDNALGSRASIAINNPPKLKHMQHYKFMRYIAPWIEAQTGLARREYEVVSVMREPVDWLGSWYRYRTRDALKEGRGKKKNYSGNVTFEEFVREVLKPHGKRPAFAQLGQPHGVALDADGAIGCDRIFPYEDLSGLYELIESRTKRPLELAKLNVSPTGDMTLGEETQKKLRAAWSFAFDLHSSLGRDGSVPSRFRVADAGRGEDREEDGGEDN